MSGFNLNSRQQAAVNHQEGPLMILAGAGSGKTRVITLRILELIKKGVPPEQILAVTFTNKAAKEMRERVLDLISEDKDINRPVRSDLPNPHVSTFHSLGVFLLRENAKELGLKRHFSVFDRSDSMRAIKLSIKQMGLDPKQFEPRSVLSTISRYKAEGITSSEFRADISDTWKHSVGRIWNAYQERLDKEGALDFDDLLLRTYILLRDNKEVRERCQNRWSYVHIDEYQDTNRVQFSITQLLTNKENNICVVGDIDQCLAKGTKITLFDGTKKSIEKIKKGDAVLSNFGSGRFEASEVTRIFSKKNKGDLVRIRTENGNTLTSTPEHIHFADFHLKTTPQSRDSNRQNIRITLCGDKRGKTPMHRISMAGNNEGAKKILESLGLSVRSAKKGSESWRFETCGKDWRSVYSIAEQIKKVFPDSQIISYARVGNTTKVIRSKNSLKFLPASSLIPGMVVCDKDGNWDLIKTIDYIKETTTVYDIDVKNTHNFIANDIVTHNSIYAWRGANIGNLLTFEEEFPKTTLILLEENYRSTKNILSAANNIIEKNVRRKDKTLFTENRAGELLGLYSAYTQDDEARFIVEKAQELIDNGAPPREIAVLYRANFQSRVLEQAFMYSGVPYQVLGTRFFDRKEVKDVISYIRAALNPNSEGDIARIVSTPPRGIGKMTLSKMFLGQESDLSPAAQKKVSDFKNVLSSIAKVAKTEKPSETIRFALMKSGLEVKLKGGDSEEQERLENIKELATLASKYDELEPEDGIERLLEDAALATDQDSLEKNHNAVKLMTVHASKGLEFDNVFVTGLEEGLFPHEKLGEDTDDEEERRLFYVALTRARKRVVLTYSMVRTIFGTQSIQTASHFLEDIGEDLIEILNQYTSPHERKIDLIDY